jgi:putative hydrolase of the HAD superfamily
MGVGRLRIRAVLLDALGTLVRLEDPVPALREQLAARCGLDVDQETAGAALAAEIAYYRAHNLEGRDRAALAGLRRDCALVLRDALGPGAHEARIEDVLAALLAALRFTPYPDVLPALERMRAVGLRLVVVSNWDVSLHDRLAETGIAERVHGAIASAELGAAKPAPAIFAHALAMAWVPAQEALHVGDSPDEDVEGARAAGIEPVLLVREGEPAVEGVRTTRSLAEVAELVA